MNENGVTSNQATSALNYLDSIQSKIEAIMNGGNIELSEPKQSNPASSRKTLSEYDKLEMLEDVMELINENYSWSRAVALRGRGYSKTSVLKMAKSAGLYKSNKNNNKELANRLAEDEIPVIECKLELGMSLKKALYESNITKAQYYKAKSRMEN